MTLCKLGLMAAIFASLPGVALDPFARLRVNPEQAPAFMPGSRGVDRYSSAAYPI